MSYWSSARTILNPSAGDDNTSLRPPRLIDNRLVGARQPNKEVGSGPDRARQLDTVSRARTGTRRAVHNALVFAPDWSDYQPRQLRSLSMSPISVRPPTTWKKCLRICVVTVGAAVSLASLGGITLSARPLGQGADTFRFRTFYPCIGSSSDCDLRLLVEGALPAHAGPASRIICGSSSTRPRAA